MSAPCNDSASSMTAPEIDEAALRLAEDVLYRAFIMSIRATQIEVVALAIMEARQFGAALQREKDAKPLTHRHVKRGSEYRVIGEGKTQCEWSMRDGAHVTIYQGTDGQYWVRPTVEFEDGRFELLRAAAIRES